MPPVPTLLEATHVLATPGGLTTALVLMALLVLTLTSVPMEVTTAIQTHFVPTLLAPSVVHAVPVGPELVLLVRVPMLMNVLEATAAIVMPLVPILLEATHALATPATMTTALVVTVLLVLTSMNVPSVPTPVSKTTTSQSPLAPTLEAHSVVPVLVPQPVMELPVSTSMTVQLTMAVAW